MNLRQLHKAGVADSSETQNGMEFPLLHEGDCSRSCCYPGPCDPVVSAIAGGPKQQFSLAEARHGEEPISCSVAVREVQS